MIECGRDAPDHVQVFARTLSGLDHLTALERLSRHMARISLSERNDFVPFYRKLSSQTDYGFKVGETVEYWYSPHTKRIGKILAINGGQVTFSDVITHLTMVKKLNTEPEQLSLFNK